MNMKGFSDRPNRNPIYFLLQYRNPLYGGRNQTIQTVLKPVASMRHIRLWKGVSRSVWCPLVSVPYNFLSSDVLSLESQYAGSGSNLPAYSRIACIAGTAAETGRWVSLRESAVHTPVGQIVVAVALVECYQEFSYRFFVCFEDAAI